ncbi:4-demethylwyosine synthase TYW1 [Candidatus Woesearchaeota archaeon]|nr:4-demethylwyosine synthase TYW1 [Candidatus Woesearchaeota archaeon]
MPISQARKQDLEKQGYRLVGNHSAIKVCEWTKKSLKDCDFCYKQQFYNIKSHRCVQMTPSLPFCNHRCIFCWRDIDFTKLKWQGKIDNQKYIIDNCIKEHINYLRGFGGNKKANKVKLKEAYSPNQFAISLSGEPTFYPKLPELIDEIRSRDSTAFLVTNGTNPEMIKKLIKHQPTQLYITLPAPNENIYKKTCNPLIKDGWKKIIQSIKLLKQFKCNTVLRLTLVKNINLTNPEQYAEIIKSSNAKFIELKAYMWVGYSRQRLTIDNMPLHEEIKEFAKKISKLTNYKIKDEKTESRVVLLAKPR